MEACLKHADLCLTMVTTIKRRLSSDCGSYTVTARLMKTERFLQVSVSFHFSPPTDLSAAVDQIRLVEFSPRIHTADGQLAVS